MSGGEVMRVLIVEDDPSMAAVLGEMLRVEALGARFDVSFAKSLSEGLAYARGADVAVLALNLPDSRGLDSIRRWNDHVPEVATVVLTGLAENVGRAAIVAGADDFLTKDDCRLAHRLPRALVYARERHRRSWLAPELLAGFIAIRERAEALCQTH